MDRRVVSKLQRLGLQPIVGLPEGFQKGDRTGKTQFFMLADVIAFRCRQLIDQRFGDEPVKEPVPFIESGQDRELQRLRDRVQELEVERAPLDALEESNRKIHGKVYRRLRELPKVWASDVCKLAGLQGEPGVLDLLKTAINEIMWELSKYHDEYVFTGNWTYDEGEDEAEAEVEAAAEIEINETPQTL